jgi:uncharacterized protein (DUF302 family)
MALSALLLALVALSTAQAQEPGRYTTTAAFDDVRFDLGNAVLARGLSIQAEADLHAMLTRTGADVGSITPIYKHAQFITMCSARYTRLMLEADPSLVPNCPFVLYAYETVGRPGEVVVGYRRLAPGQTEAGRKAVAEVEAMLDGIVRDAVK